jgi:uncharacterized membrane protein YphA (DoxX/SURF4 family)
MIKWTLRLLVSGLFLYSGLIKLMDLPAFAQAVEGYDLLPEAWVNRVAVFVPWVELWCAVALWVTPIWRSSAYALITGMLLVFTVAKISGVMRGLDISCGCTGSDNPLNWASVLENFVWLALNVSGWMWDRRYTRRVLNPRSEK